MRSRKYNMREEKTNHRGCRGKIVSLCSQKIIKRVRLMVTKVNSDMEVKLIMEFTGESEIVY